MNEEEKPLREAFASAIAKRKTREENERREKERQKMERIPRSVTATLYNVRRVAEHGGGWEKVTVFDHEGGDPIRPVDDPDLWNEVLRQLREIGMKEGFEVLPSPSGVAHGWWWAVWDREAWNAQNIQTEPRRVVMHEADTYRDRLFALWQETDAMSGLYVAECSGAMKDLLMELGMEWNEEGGEYIFP